MFSILCVQLNISGFKESLEAHRLINNALWQACQTQTRVRAAEWNSKTEKLSAGRSLEKLLTFFYLDAFSYKKSVILCILTV